MKPPKIRPLTGAPERWALTVIAKSCSAVMHAMAAVGNSICHHLVRIRL
ncbi:MAG: hypothetical protein WAO35_10190 [Terriglobia bacterium]